MVTRIAEAMMPITTILSLAITVRRILVKSPLQHIGRARMPRLPTRTHPPRGHHNIAIRMMTLMVPRRGDTVTLTTIRMTRIALVRVRVTAVRMLM